MVQGWAVWAGPTAKALGPRVPATVPLARSCRARARAVSWARSAAHALPWPSCRVDTGTLPAMSCLPWDVPKGRAAGPWAVWKYIADAKLITHV
jgi:hypothetical protein